MENKKVIKVSSKSPVPQLCNSIIACVEEGFEVEVRAVGAGAVNQMYKAITSARGQFATKGKDLFIKPAFDETSESGEERTVMVAHIVFK